MRLVAAIVLAVWMSGLFGQPALADKRVALVIGNSNYQKVNQLANPANDAAMLADTFTQAKFDVVTLRKDLTATEMRRVLREFADKARSADIAVLYYAGHGMEIDGNNYLIPVDAVLERDTDVYDEAISLDRVLIAVEPAKQLRLIILDACRDNPFAKAMKRTIAMRGIGQGLAKVEPTNPNTMIAFAAKAGFTALDGDKGQRNSPYAAALAAHLTTPGLDLRKAFGFVRDDVLKATVNRQEPFIYGSLGGDDVALIPSPAPGAPAPTVADPSAAIRHDYELAERVGTKEAWDSFIATYPDGFYAKLAQAQRNKLAAEEAHLVAAERAKAAAEEKTRLAAEQTKAAAEAKAAEEARIAAEKQKAVEEAKLAEAERARAAAQARADEGAKLAAEKKALEAGNAAAAAKATQESRTAAEKAAQERIAKAEEEAKAAAERAKLAVEARAAEEARVAELEKALQEAEAAEAARVKADTAAKATAPVSSADSRLAPDKSAGRLSSLTPAGQAEKPPAADDTPRRLLAELRRVGCFTGSIDGSWNDAAQQSLARFNKYAGTTLDTRLASLDTLGVVRGMGAHVCPLVCEHGYRPDGETCTKIVCKAGFQLNDANECEKSKTRKPEMPDARHDGRPEAQPVNRPSISQSDSDFLHRCGATSCSMALRGCIRKTAIMGVDSSICSAKYNACLQTGSFVGRFCNLRGLARN
jgi:uncharacterized caspase-like protein